MLYFANAFWKIENSPRVVAASTSWKSLQCLTVTVKSFGPNISRGHVTYFLNAAISDENTWSKFNGLLMDGLYGQIKEGDVIPFGMQLLSVRVRLDADLPGAVVILGVLTLHTSVNPVLCTADNDEAVIVEEYH